MNPQSITPVRDAASPPSLIWACGFIAWLRESGDLIEAPRRGLGFITECSINPTDPRRSRITIDWMTRNGGLEVLQIEDLEAIHAGPALGVLP